MNIEELINENLARSKVMAPYDPVVGVGSFGERIPISIKKHDTVYIPIEMYADTDFCHDIEWNDFVKLRFKYDFEFWCAMCVKIKDKAGGGNIAFQLNAPQRRALGEIENMRRAHRPIRLIMLKARQWGGSTLIQMYMAWIQMVIKCNHNSMICAHVKDTASVIRGMYSKMLREYPLIYWDEEKPPRFRPYEKSINISEIMGRDCLVVIGSSENQEAVRGNDISMAHLSEVAFWRNTPTNNPEDLIRAVCASVALLPLTLIALESTANGVGNYFHTEWLRATAGKSDKIPIFVAWHEIEIYRMTANDPMQVWNDMDAYERKLWDEERLTLEQIYWYQQKRKEYTTHRQMMAEYPTDAIEAFTATDRSIFAPDAVEMLRRDCIKPQFIGELAANAEKGKGALMKLRFCSDITGKLKVWKTPEDAKPLRNRYIVAVDAGGCSDMSDYSVIAVFDRINMCDDGIPEVVAQWRGHIDHDLLAWKAAQIARWYCNALLVIESNTYETENTEGDHGEFIFTEIARSYHNLYYRASAIGGGERVGFHTNRATKTMVINSQIAIIRDHGYIERDDEAVNEHVVYERKSNGSCGAKDGCHDDILMTRAIGLHICYHEKLPIPTAECLKTQ